MMPDPSTCPVCNGVKERPGDFLCDKCKQREGGRIAFFASVVLAAGFLTLITALLGFGRWGWPRWASISMAVLGLSLLGFAANVLMHRREWRARRTGAGQRGRT